jgi:hypothetical protein
LLQHDQDRLSWFDIFAGSAVHAFMSPFLNPCGHSYHKPEKKITESHTHAVRTTPRTGMNAPAGTIALDRALVFGETQPQKVHELVKSHSKPSEPRNAGSRFVTSFFNSHFTQGRARTGGRRRGG